MGAFWEIFAIVLLSSVKFLPAPFVAIGTGFGFLQTVIITFSGGIAGIFFFYYLGSFITNKLKKRKIEIDEEKASPQRFFTKKNKLIVSVKRKYGLLGIAFLTPAIISIPIGCILAARYFGKDPRTLTYLSVSLLLWCGTLTSIAHFFKETVSFFN